jgi:hypothetical protein
LRRMARPLPLLNAYGLRQLLTHPNHSPEPENGSRTGTRTRTKAAMTIVRDPMTKEPTMTTTPPTASSKIYKQWGK